MYKNLVSRRRNQMRELYNNMSTVLMQPGSRRIKAQIAVDSRFNTNAERKEGLCKEPLSDFYKDELYELANELELPVTKKTSKKELCDLIAIYADQEGDLSSPSQEDFEMAANKLGKELELCRDVLRLGPSEIDVWLCQAINNILNAIPLEKSSLSVIEDYGLLSRTIRIFQDSIENQPSLAVIAEISPEEIAMYYPNLEKQREKAVEHTLDQHNKIIVDVEADLKALDPTSDRARKTTAFLRKMQKENPVEKVDELFSQHLDTARLSIRLDKFINRYIVLLKSLVEAYMYKVPAPSLQELSLFITNVIEYLMNPLKVAKFATHYKLKNSLLFQQEDPSRLVYLTLPSENNTMKERFRSLIANLHKMEI